MMRAHEKQNKKTLFFKILSIIAVTVLCVNRVFFAHHEGLLEQSAARILYPFLAVKQLIVEHVYSMRTYLVTLGELKRERSQLIAQRDALLAQTIEMRSALMHLDATKELREFSQRYTPAQYYCARVLMRTFTDYEHSWHIDKGSSHGIVRDMIVVSNNCLVGKIVQVYPGYSKVQLITDRACNVAVYCDATKTTGIYSGLNRIDNAILAHVGHLQNLQVGDMLISSGQGLVYPHGFALGTIKSYTVDGVYYAVAITPLVDFSTTAYCVVLGKE
jgi:rod shape-determining protein MreC